MEKETDFKTLANFLNDKEIEFKIDFENILIKVISFHIGEQEFSVTFSTEGDFIHGDSIS